MNANHPSRIQRGFTLIELVIVLAVLGALAAVAVPQLTGLQEEADLAGTATTVSSELGNAFAQDLTDGSVDTVWETSVASDLCDAMTDSFAPALSGYDLNTDSDGVTVTVPNFVSNEVGSVECNLVTLP